MFKTKLLSAVVAAALLSGLLSGCGTAANTSDTAAAGRPENTEAAAGTAAPVQDLPTDTETGESGNTVSAAVLSEEERYEMNAFLSFFAEQDFPGFSDFTEDFADLADFMHLYVRAHESSRLCSLTLANGVTYEAVSSDDADVIFDRFFEETPSAALSADYVSSDYGGDLVYGMYRDGFYCFMPDYGEIYNRFAAVGETVQNADGTYTVDFVVYTVNAGNGSPADYYGFSSEEAAACSKLTAESTGTAVIASFEYNGTGSYSIRSYRIDLLE